MAVDRHDRREILNGQLPDGFRTAKLLEPHAHDTLHALSVDLSCATNPMKVNAAVFLASFLRFWSHAALSNDCFDAESLDDVGLIGLLTNGCCWSRRDDAVFAFVLQYYRPAVVNHGISNHV